jgi:hypothetical protein
LHRIEANRYERDPRARKACPDHWGYYCLVSNFSFEERYGPIGKNFIHGHHTVELSQVSADYCVKPVTDLRPVCPNCHTMIRRGTGRALTINELAQLLRCTYKSQIDVLACILPSSIPAGARSKPGAFPDGSPGANSAHPPAATGHESAAQPTVN